ncbi:LAME_0C05424g1_1 [Lachancea meyersii CBS 8951]|uniref:LAME_0C05424g1_1 n=1 Tax=Lachancea meyersii CBS 8951 TaxID=1266667 RepID=A0A1G4J1L6_9SACH|nr:LAME_0C05424g1_1 [Lachancea meyersii CBS 8951]
MTWRRFINSSLKKSHGVFGEASEYHFLNRDQNIAYLKVFVKDADTFESAISTFISSEELTEVPVLALILQKTNDISKLEVTDDDVLWHKIAISEEMEEMEEMEDTSMT